MTGGAVARGLRRARRGWERAGSGIGRRKLALASTIGVVAIALAAAALVRAGVHAADRAADEWGAGIDIVLYLEPEVGAAGAESLADGLALVPGVGAAEVVPPDRAMARLERAFGERSDALLGVEPPLLPMTVEVELSPALADRAELARYLEAELADHPAVGDLQGLSMWTEEAGAAARGLRAIFAALFAAAAGAAVFVIAAVLELSLRARRRERALLEALGATPLAARAPIAIEGAAIGAAGAALAAAVALAATAAMGEAVGELARGLDPGADALLPAREIAALVGIGAAAGAGGGILASRREGRR